MEISYTLTLEYYKWLFDDKNIKLNLFLDSSIAEKNTNIIPLVYYPDQYSELFNSELFTRLKRISQTRIKISFRTKRCIF